MTSSKLIRSSLAAGVLLLLAQPTIASNLVTNGGFETGDFTGWTLTGNVNGSTRVTDTVNDPTYIHVHSGTYGVVAGPQFPDVYLSQTLPTTIGQTYIVDFWLASNRGSPNEFTVSWNGTLLDSIVNSPEIPFTEFMFNVTGTGTDTLKFGMAYPPGAWGLDDVSVTPAVVPLPGTLLLFGSGLGGLCKFCKNRRMKSA